jgi:hypothetical protein
MTFWKTTEVKVV